MTNKSQQLRERANLWLARALEVETETTALANQRHAASRAATELWFETASAKLERQQDLWKSREEEEEDPKKTARMAARVARIEGPAHAGLMEALALRQRRADLLRDKALAFGVAKAKKFRDRADRLNAEAEQLEREGQ